MRFTNVLAGVGEHTLRRLRRVAYYTAVAVAVLRVGLRPGTWRRTVRDVFARQILYSGVEATPFTSQVAFLVGVSVVVQVQLWLRKVGQSELLGPVLVAVVIRELGPLLANVIVIGRSGNAMAAELGHMKYTGEVRALDAQGLDPFVYLVVPRVLGAMISVLCLTIVFIAVCLFSGYLSGLLLGARTGGAGGFLASIAKSIGPWDVFNVIAKSLIPGMLAGVICCAEGLGIENRITEIPKAVTRAVQHSVAALFLVSAVISVLTYL